MKPRKPGRKESAAPGDTTARGAAKWLMLVHLLPATPSNVRVKTWRRLQSVGAVGLKNSVYVLPNSAQAREDFEWIKTEIVAMKGSANILVAETLDPATEQEIVAAFQRARATEYALLQRDAQDLLKKLRTARNVAAHRAQAARTARQLRERWSAVQTVDFFQAPAREESGAVLDLLERRLAGDRAGSKNISVEGGTLMKEEYTRKTWVTRPRPGIDRMASAWLIRRFIDSEAKFIFAPKAEEKPSAVPFDMYGVQFSHEGNRCTFETLARLFRVTGQAIERIGQIVHNLDLKDKQYQVPEEAVVGRLVEGLRQVYQDDQELLERGMDMFEALYRSFTSSPLRAKGASAGRGRKHGASYLGMA
jgi:hypothetical protein